MSATIVKATGLTCNHCAVSVSEEIQEIPAVTDVKVEVVKGGESTVTIEHQGPLETEAVAAAIREAGFTPVQ